MSAYKTNDISFDVPASTVTRANGGFKEGDSEVIGRWVQRGTGNTVVLVADNARPLGVIARITGNKVAVAMGPIVKGKRSGDAALANGIPITGATRNVTGEANARGFIKAGRTDSAANASTNRGMVLDGGSTSTAGSQGALVEVLMFT